MHFFLLAFFECLCFILFNSIICKPGRNDKKKVKENDQESNAIYKLDFELLYKQNTSPNLTEFKPRSNTVESSVIFGTIENLLYPPYKEKVLFKNSLPSCYIIPLSNSYNIECKGYKYGDSNKKLGEHNMDHLIHNWLVNEYEKTVTTTFADSFFLPAYVRDCFEDMGQIFPWASLERDIDTVASKIKKFSYDRTFISSSFPLDHPDNNYREIRHISDIRYLRVDNSLTVNGRDIFIPYFVNNNNNSGSVELTPRKGFLFVPCKNAIGKIDYYRNWRGKAFDIFKNISESTVTLLITEDEFNFQLTINDFCVILPGDTVSTAKLYKSIFAGCIPVVFISYYEQLPFSKFIDCNKFTILIPKEKLNFADEVYSVINRLIEIRNNKILLSQYKKSLSEVSILFDWNNYKWPSVYHFIMLEINESKRLL